MWCFRMRHQRKVWNGDDDAELLRVKSREVESSMA